MTKRTHYPAPPERTIIEDLTPQLRAWFADTVAELIAGKHDRDYPANGHRAASGNQIACRVSKKDTE